MLSESPTKNLIGSKISLVSDDFSPHYYYGPLSSSACRWYLESPKSGGGFRGQSDLWHVLKR